MIKEGPLSAGINFPYPDTIDHDMVLSGWEVIYAGDKVYHSHGINDEDIIIDTNSPLIGTTYWIFKNSWGSYIPFKYTSAQIQVPLKLLGLLFFNSNPLSVYWSDEDGDGYYWWGIGPKPAGCPGSPDEEDCDDSNPLLGPYNTDSLQGLLYECRLNPCTLSNIPKYTPIYQYDTTWLTDQHLNVNIVIPSGHVLKIYSNIYFCPDAKIVVSPGARLELRDTTVYGKHFSAKLTSGCGQFWGGIDLWGDPTLSQIADNQGTIIVDTAIIENAICGVETLNPGWLPYWPGGGTPAPWVTGLPTGGIIKATGSTFKNNIIGVEFYPYRDGTKENISFFDHCIFVTDQDLLTNVKPQYLLKLDGVNSINIKNCTFENNNYSYTSLNYNIRGTGIFSYNSELYVHGPLTKFERLKYGIYAITSGLGQSSVILKEALFTSNKYGSYFSGYTEMNPFEIDSNNYQFNQNIGNADSLYGLYLNNCSGYRVQLNKFDATGYSGAPNKNLLGLIVNNSGGNLNYIYNNNFKKLKYALQGQNKNWDILSGIMGPNSWKFEPYLQSGLCFICNDFSLDTNDLVDNYFHDKPPVQKGITYYQRNRANLPAWQQPAGNLFSMSHCENCNNYDINMDDSVQNIQYSYHYYYPPSIRPDPKYIFNSTKVAKDPMYVLYTDSLSCPDTGFYLNLSRGELNSIINQANYKIDSLTSLLEQLLDGGSTDTLQDNVENSTPNQSYDIYISLMNPSPFLSDTVLKTSIAKEEVLPNAMIRDILVANPQSAKNDKLLNVLDNRITPLPDSMWAEILDGQDTIGAKEHLLWELSGWIQTRDFYFKSLINLYLTNTVDSWANDSLIALLENTNRLEAKYYLIHFYLKQYNFTQAANVLQDIPFSFTLSTDEQRVYQKYSTLIPIMESIHNDTIGYWIPDSVQTITLEQIVSDDHDLPSALARNILIASGLMNYQEPIITETSVKSSKTIHHYGKNVRISDNLKVYPNPCKDYIIAEYTKGKPADVCYIILIDKNGKKIATYSLKRLSDQVIIPLQQYSAGTYFIQLTISGATRGIKKIILVK